MGYSSGVMVPLSRVLRDFSNIYRRQVAYGTRTPYFRLLHEYFEFWFVKDDPPCDFLHKLLPLYSFFFDFSRDKGKDKKQCLLAVMGRVWQVIISCFDSIHIFDVFGCLTLAYFGREISLYYCVRYELLTLHYHWVLQC